jgi:hypothetical protein
MPDEPLVLLQILAGLPDEADYDAVHAALMATERGRRFLTEYADRNRHAETTAIVSAIARIEATLRGEGPPQADAAGDLMEIAAAIGRIQAALAAGTPPAPDVSAAIERLSDIAFMLHERPVEATLCDGLDAAVREVSDANMRSQSAAEDVRKAAELLHALASRVSAMMTRSTGGSGADQPAGENVAAESASGAGLFEPATDDGETFAEAVAALAASLPTLADAPNEPAEAAPEPESGQGAQAPAIEAAPSDDGLLPVDEAQQTAAETEVADDRAAPPQFTSTQSSAQSSAQVSLSEAVLSQAFSDDHFASANFSGEAPAPEETGSEQALSEEPPSEDVLPAQNFPTDPDPEEDLADLFEPQPVPTTPIEAAAPVTADNPVPAELPAEPPRAVPPPPARAIPRPPGSDPLAAVRDLSEEELIALFS